MSQSPDLPGSKEELHMTPERAAEHLRVIRELMERPVRQTTRSGASAVIAGLLALAGCGATALLFRNTTPDTPWQTGGLWLTVLALAVVLDLWLTARRAKKLGQTYWGRAQWQTAMAITPGFVLGGLITFALFYYGPCNERYYSFIPFVWMLFYGLALWTVGLFSITEVKVLSVAFMVAGLAGAFWFSGHALLALALTFGGFHLVYGTVVWIRHGG
jgi:hypothetical protein